MRNRKSANAKSAIANCVFVIAVSVIAIWCFGSFMEVITHNGTEDVGYVYSPYNIFIIAFDELPKALGMEA